MKDGALLAPPECAMVTNCLLFTALTEIIYNWVNSKTD